jgi:hypothetical protein
MYGRLPYNLHIIKCLLCTPYYPESSSPGQRAAILRLFVFCSLEKWNRWVR